MTQDFSKKVAIVIRRDLPSWQVLNAVAHISAYFGNKMEEEFGTGDFFISKDGIKYPRNSQYAIIVLGAGESELKAFANEVRDSGLDHMEFLREMIETTDDDEIQAILSEKEDNMIEYLGVGIFGDKERVGKLSKRFSLWK